MKTNSILEKNNYLTHGRGLERRKHEVKLDHLKSTSIKKRNIELAHWETDSRKGRQPKQRGGYLNLK